MSLQTAAGKLFRRLLLLLLLLLLLGRRSYADPLEAAEFCAEGGGVVVEEGGVSPATQTLFCDVGCRIVVRAADGVDDDELDEDGVLVLPLLFPFFLFPPVDG